MFSYPSASFNVYQTSSCNRFILGIRHIKICLAETMVQVPVECLLPPVATRCFRDLSEEHVKEMVQVM